MRLKLRAADFKKHRQPNDCQAYSDAEWGQFIIHPSGDDIGSGNFLKALDRKLQQYGLELVNYDTGTSDYMFDIVKQEGK